MPGCGGVGLDVGEKGAFLCVLGKRTAERYSIRRTQPQEEGIEGEGGEGEFLFMAPG